MFSQVLKLLPTSLARQVMQSTPSVYPYVCFHSTFRTDWPLALIFCMCVGHYRGLHGIETERSRSRSRRGRSDLDRRSRTAVFQYFDLILIVWQVNCAEASPTVCTRSRDIAAATCSVRTALQRTCDVPLWPTSMPSSPPACWSNSPLPCPPDAIRRRGPEIGLTCDQCSRKGVQQIKKR